MRLTKVHVDYWRFKKANPRFAKFVCHNSVAAPVDINDCVNSHSHFVREPDGERAASNLLNLLKMVRKRTGSLVPYLDKITKDPGTVISPQRRSAFAKKWRDKITQSRRLT